MGPTQDPPEQGANQGRIRTCLKKRRHRPRLRRCLLKGCERRFRPQQPRARFCSEDCRRKARQWSRWKAQKRYRATGPGKQKRQAQSRRYRWRVRRRKQARAATPGTARVITANFFRLHVRPSRLLRDVRPHGSFSAAAVLFAGVPSGTGTRPGAGTALEGALRGRARPAGPPPDGSFALILWES